MAFQELLPSDVTPLKSKVTEESPPGALVKVKGEPAGVQTCPTAAGAAVQPADPPKPGAMKVMSRAGNVGADRKLMKSWAAKVVPTGSVEKFRFSIPACVLPRPTKLPLTLFPIVA